MFLVGLKFAVELVHLTVFLFVTINRVHLMSQNALQDPGV